MTDVTIWISLTIFMLLMFSMRKNPFIALKSFVHNLYSSRKFLIHFVALLGVLMINKVELWIELKIPKQPDFTSIIYKLEGNFIPLFQQLFLHPIVTFITTFFYIVVFPTLMIVSILLYSYQKNDKLFYAVCYAIMINYIIAMPFYLFFPVVEVWSFLPNVHFLMSQVFPSFEIDYRPLSGLDNCFPSLHTSISVTIATIALSSGNKFWSRFTVFSSAFIIFSIFYLGIHWIVDMVGGVILGVAAAKLGLLISSGISVKSYMTTQSKERSYSE